MTLLGQPPGLSSRPGGSLSHRFVAHTIEIFGRGRKSGISVRWSHFFSTKMGQGSQQCTQCGVSAGVLDKLWWKWFWNSFFVYLDGVAGTTFTGISIGKKKEISESCMRYSWMRMVCNGTMPLTYHLLGPITPFLVLYDSFEIFKFFCFLRWLTILRSSHMVCRYHDIIVEKLHQIRPWSFKMAWIWGGR